LKHTVTPITIKNLVFFNVTFESFDQTYQSLNMPTEDNVDIFLNPKKPAREVAPFVPKFSDPEEIRRRGRDGVLGGAILVGESQSPTRAFTAPRGLKLTAAQLEKPKRGIRVNRSLYESHFSLQEMQGVESKPSVVSETTTVKRDQKESILSVGQTARVVSQATLQKQALYRGNGSLW
jgi:hypothetical protein